MDKVLTDFLVKEIKIGRFLLAPLDMLLLVGMTVSGIMLRYSVAGYTALPDFDYYLVHEAGLKLTGYVFDWALSVVLALLICSLTGHKVRSMLAYGITFVLPVFVSGSAMWGMGDGIYLFLLLVSFGLLLKEKRELSLLVYGLSVFFHGNALFLLPLYVLLYLQGKVRLYGFLSPLAGGILHRVVTGITDFPPFTAERLLLESRGERLLGYNCPNLFTIIGTDKFVPEYEKVALAFSLGLSLTLVVVLWTRRALFGREQLFRASLLFCLFLPYTLPGMNERSFLPACLISLIYGFVYLKRFYLPIVLATITYISYSACFRGESAVPLAGAAFVVLALLVWLVRGVLQADESCES